MAARPGFRAGERRGATVRRRKGGRSVLLPPRGIVLRSRAATTPDSLPRIPCRDGLLEAMTKPKHSLPHTFPAFRAFQRLILVAPCWLVLAASAAGGGPTTYSCGASGGVDCTAPIPDGTLGGLVSSFGVEGCDVVEDADLALRVDHGWTGDLKAVLRDPRGRRFLLVDRPGATGLGWGCEYDGVDAILDDEASEPVEDACVDDQGGTLPAIGGNLLPAEPLSPLDGLGGNGTWTLRLSDFGEGDTGTLLDWSLILTCGTRQVDLVLSKVASAGGVAPGGTVTYTLTVTNEGPDRASGVMVTDLLPPELSYTSDDCGTLVDGAQVQWRAGSLEAGASRSCEITVTASSGASGELVNSASASALEDDLDPADNEAQAVVEVGLFVDGFESGDTSAWTITSGGVSP